ncbi:hypothetical protein O159_03090 [Leifsonia xyli subsp. cynodontis DSM 46306]|uniref:Uncharacterized protein n=1 Tax=Leifsonia xyli subsp. cynodontis DSM 46306 TaxID=1389489 RepID=U3P6I7_LEIXC|nr:hypothetical protein [Leifsonia xyli]AGW40532.1 hypothetical protein O159_03090 [Leifsonia xyli subsp. cynodontis DSM 46306]
MPNSASPPPVTRSSGRCPPPGAAHARHVVLSIPAVSGAALAGENGLRFTLTGPHGVIADRLSADQLRRALLNLGPVAAGAGVAVSLRAELPAAADDGFRTANAALLFRFSSESSVLGGMLAATGLDTAATLALAVALIVIALALLLWKQRRRLGGAIVPVTGAACALALAAGSANSWTAFTDAAALGTTVQGRIRLRIAGAGALSSSLRYSIEMDANGKKSVLLGDPGQPASGAAAPAAGLPVDLGVVPPAGVRLKDGESWPASANPSLRTLTVSVHLLDEPALRASSSGTATVTLDLNGTTSLT